MIGITEPKRKYFSHEFSLEYCPECKGTLTEKACTILLAVRSARDKAEFLTNLSGSRFCERCPVVVFDSSKVEYAAIAGLKEETNFKYTVLGIVDLDAVPEEKRNLELGTDENPLPLIDFLPPLPSVTGHYSLNDPCPCGSGKKYKRCCGVERSLSRRRRR
ncbi:MAG: SEC-C domain-containing protein [Phaeodactylibacter sp.]|nr:SEC-C domain-containing protein [Phaeodactylibacter sp.]